MARICLISQARLVDPNYAIQHSHLFKILFTMAQPSFEFAFEGVCHTLFIKVQTSGGAQCGEVVAVNDDMHSPFLMTETTWRCRTLNKSKVEKALGVAILPYCSCVSRSVHASYETTDHVLGHTELGWKAHIESPVRDSIKVRFLHIDKRQL